MFSRIASFCIAVSLMAPMVINAQTTQPGRTTPQARPPQPAPVKQAPVAPVPAAKPLNFKKTASGIEYAYIIDKPTSAKPQEGEVIRVHMQSAANNRLLYTSTTVNKGKPVEFSMNKPSFKGDISEVIAFMSVGDSMVAMVDAETIYKNTKNKMPDFIKKGDKVQYFIRLVSIKSKEQVQKEQQEAMNKQIKEQMAKQQKDKEKQKITDDKNLQAYFKKNKITPTKTASGLYYLIIEEGTGMKAQKDYEISMNYSGYLMDGTKVDSNTDTLFKHMTPYTFRLGTGSVMAGWEEGVALLSKGSKAKLFVPSGMAYGSTPRPANANTKAIPANSPLIFDLEVLDVKEPVNEDLELQKIFKQRNINPTKTASGLYYQITQEGNGPLPQAGEKMVMNYTGFLLDGTKFDSNVDTAFKHTTPFEFELGKGMVVKGWDEGIALLKKGSKATLYIPSNLAYGGRPKPGGPANPKGIPAYSTLIFDVELVDIKPKQ
ncbi:MAG: FKBP-type peptidyl-prolyl cis-trans isomerase [Chitinophagaceae bacterium]|nr:FKBP-type peptidyl-prolyl cis-trans isomerase [Chitinophagaceae bacterium]